MCLAIPGKIVEIIDVENRIAKVEVESDLAVTLARKIADLTRQPLKLMEVCGGHTHDL
jgi:hydrogenase maturation factor